MAESTMAMTEKAYPQPTLLAVAWAVCTVTAREILREKLLYNVVLITFLLFGVGTLASRLTYIHPERIMLDFGLASVFLSSSGIAILMGSIILAREIDRRTIHVALSHPVSQFQFACGKYLGLAAVILLNWCILVPCFLGMLSLSGGTTSTTLFVALFFALLQGWMLGALALMLSSIFTSSVSVIISIGLFFLGTNVSQLRWLASREQSEAKRRAIELFASLVPNLEHFSLGTRVTYALEVPTTQVLIAVVYAFAWIAVALILAGFLLKRKEI